MTRARTLADYVAGGTTATEFDYLDGVTSNVQTQLDNKPSKNMIINGAMQVAQRGTITGATSGAFGGPDRFAIHEAGDLVVTMSQDSDVPTGQGFASSMKLDVTTADSSVANADYAYLGYKFEGQDVQSLRKGTANAMAVTLSFWIKSTITGTYIIQLYDNDNSRHISKSYTVSVSNTWEKKTITFAGDTTGAFGNDNAYSLQVYFWLMAGADYTGGTLASSWASFTQGNASVGQVNAVNSASNNIFITGVQLELGSSATPFEHRSFSDELARCQRYCHVIGDTVSQAFGPGVMYTSTNGIIYVTTPVPMRSTPTLSKNAGGTGTTWLHSYVGASGLTSNPTPEIGELSTNGRTSTYRIYVPSSNNSTTAGYGSWNMIMPNASFTFNAEL